MTRTYDQRLEFQHAGVTYLIDVKYQFGGYVYIKQPDGTLRGAESLPASFPYKTIGKPLYLWDGNRRVWAATFDPEPSL